MRGFGGWVSSFIAGYNGKVTVVTYASAAITIYLHR